MNVFSFLVSRFIANLIYCRQNAVIFILCRNKEMNEIAETIKNFEERFNKRFNYPYVFYNDVEFTEEFKTTLGEVCRGNVKFGKIDSSDWNTPSHIDLDKAEADWKPLVDAQIPYASSKSYRNMCRFYSRKFYKLPLILQYKYYWRIEPGVKFHCDIEDDVFDEMADGNKDYGFVITMRDFMLTIKSLHAVTQEFIQKNYSVIPKINNLKFMYTNGEYNACHFWSNFEIGNFEFFRSELYEKYIDFLDKSGGFYYQRWGDAPVHSIAVSLFMSKERVMFFNKIGYTHDNITHCPADGKNCDCDIKNSIDFMPLSCLPGFLQDTK